MKCICLKCGTKVHSNKLVFNFTGFIKKELGKLLIDENNPVSAGFETCFNNIESENPILEGENKLWNAEMVQTEIIRENSRYVSYQLPYDVIKQKAEGVRGEKLVGQEIDEFKNWLKGKEQEIKEKRYILWLRKTGDGEIHFNQVFTESGEVIAMKRLCPKCGEEMSYWSGRYKEICLTVLGGERVSKSTTLTACAAAFIFGRGEIRWEGSEEDESYIKFKRDYLDLYKAGKKVKPTNNNDEESIPKVCFKVTIGGIPMCLTFIDLPGEYNNQNGIDQKIYEKYKNYYDNIDFVWYCTDASEVLQLEGTADDQSFLAELGNDGNVIDLAQLKLNIQNLSAFFNFASKTVPIAYILGKTDVSAIGKADREEYGLYSTEDDVEDSVLDVKKFFIQATKVKEYIEKYNPDLVKAVEENFTDHCYIAISAYGYSPQESANNDGAIMYPYHCKLPFLWMLALIGGIDVKFKRHRRRLFGRYIKEEVRNTINNLNPYEQKVVLHELCMRGPSAL